MDFLFNLINPRCRFCAVVFKYKTHLIQQYNAVNMIMGLKTKRTVWPMSTLMDFSSTFWPFDQTETVFLLKMNTFEKRFRVVVCTLKLEAFEKDDTSLVM